MLRAFICMLMLLLCFHIEGILREKISMAIHEGFNSLQNLGMLTPLPTTHLVFSALQKFTSQNPIYHKYSPSKVSHYNMRMCGSYTYTCMCSILGHGTCTCTYMNVTQLKKAHIH